MKHPSQYSALNLPSPGDPAISPFTSFLACQLPRFEPSDVVLDVGCGSGILLSMAYHNGARRLCGVDIDIQACNATRQNLSRLAGCDLSINHVSLNGSYPASGPDPTHILLNPPTMPNRAATPSFARDTGEDGEFSAMRRMLEFSASALKTSGQVHIVVSSLVGIGRLREIAASLRLGVTPQRALCVPFRSWYYDIYTENELAQFVANGMAWTDKSVESKSKFLAEAIIYCHLERIDST